MKLYWGTETLRSADNLSSHEAVRCSDLDYLSVCSVALLLDCVKILRIWKEINPSAQEVFEPGSIDEPKNQPKHIATIFVTRRTKLLCLSASDLARFGRKVQQELQSFAVKRRTFCQQRKAAIHVSRQRAICCRGVSIVQTF